MHRSARSGRLLAAALVALLGATACSSSSGEAIGAPDLDGGAPVVPGDVDGGSRKAPCSEPAESRPAGSSCIKTVTGRLVDDATAAPLTLVTTVCGAGLCLFAKPADTNGFSVDVNRFVDLDAFVVHVDGRPNHANVFVRLARQSSDAVVLTSPIRVPRLDAVGTALPETPPSASTTVRAGDVAITLAAGTTIELAFADAALLDEGRKLRSGPVSKELAGDPAIVALHALAPFGATLAPAADVVITLPVGHGLADGTVVDLVGLEDELDDPATGTLRVVGAGVVTGGIARSDPGRGLARLTWVGVRRRGS